MREYLIACETLRDELIHAFQITNTGIPVIWIESGLHNTPQKLHSRLQETLESLDSCDRVYLLFGSCGNAALGLQTGNFELIMPKVDDCISLLMGSPKKRADFARKHAAYYLTEGWMRGERNLWVEYQYTLEKYGKEQADYIAEVMYGHYKTLGILDTGVYPVDALLEKTKIIADTLGLQQRVVPATTRYIEALLTGPWPRHQFCRIKPNSVINHDDLKIEINTETLSTISVS